MVNKVTVTPVTGANNITNINDNFSKIAKVINDDLLSRKVATGQPNQVMTTLDMNGQRLINLPDPKTGGEPITFRYVESIQASVDGLEDLVVEAQGAVVGAQLANSQAQSILANSQALQADVIVKAAQVNSQSATVAAQAATVNTQAGQVATNATNAANSAAASSASATTASTAAGTATTQATNAASSATAANTAKTDAQAASTSAIAARDAAAISATNAANSAASVNQAYLLNRANHTGTQAISTIVNLQTSLDAKKNITDNTTIAQGGTGATTAAGARTNLGLGSAATAAILGTVSQSGGVPTGAIFQTGSNTNGGFVRYADGTQICYQRIVLASASYAAGSPVSYSQWTFPAAFSPAAPAITHQIVGAYSHWMASGWEIISQSALTNLFIRNGFTSALTTSLDIHLVAVGRWF